MTTTKIDPDSLHLYDFDENSKSLYITGEICEDLYRKVAYNLQILDLAHPNKNLTIFLRTCGGDIQDALSIYDLIKSCRSKICVVGIGIVQSAGVLILQSASNGFRYLTPNCRVMIHKGTGSVTENHLTDITRGTTEINKVADICDGIISKSMGISLKQYKRWYEHDSYFSAEEAIKNKLADKIYKKSFLNT